MSILVTGGSGMVGKNLQKILSNAFYLQSSDCDLRDRKQVQYLFKNNKYHTVIHLAADVGGIKKNASQQYEMYLNNLLMNSNIVDECVRRNIKLITLSSTCVYPKELYWPSLSKRLPEEIFPREEWMVGQGPLEPTNAGYAEAKLQMQKQLEFAREQYEYDKWMILYSSNLYGPHDNFDPDTGHLISSFMTKIHAAKLHKESSVPAFGNGRQLRQFTYVEDLAKALYFLVTDNFDSFKKIQNCQNFAYSENLPVYQIISKICDVVGYWPEIVYNNQLGGIYRKDVKSSVQVPWTSLEDGLSKTYDWFLKNEKV